MKGLPSRTRTITPQQIAQRRGALASVAAGNSAAVAPQQASVSAAPLVSQNTKSPSAMTMERRLNEKRRRDILRNKLGR